MKTIIFVCLGNICRSPMAEMMMNELIQERGLAKQVQVESRSTSTYEIGNSPHPLAIKELKKQEVPIIRHRAQQISTSDFDKAELVVGMDKQNIIDLKQMAPASDRDKIQLAYSALNKDSDVQDPWYDHKFDRTYRQLSELLPAWLDQVSEKL